MKVKCCGLMRMEDALMMNEFLPDYVGMVFARSPRKVSIETAEAMATLLDPRIFKVGVFVNQTVAEMTFTALKLGLDVLQLHGDEPIATIQNLRELLPSVQIWKAIRVENELDIDYGDHLNADMLLLDSYSPKRYGGTGMAAPWQIIADHRPNKPFFLAGGLQAGNVGQAIALTTPFGVDVSSGIETNKQKDREKISAFIKAVRGNNHA